jgi:hypothetical protein
MKKTLITILVATVLTASLSAEDAWKEMDLKACTFIKNLPDEVYEGLNPITMKKNKKNIIAQCKMSSDTEILNFDHKIKAQAEVIEEIFGKFSSLEKLLIGDKETQIGISWKAWLRQYNKFLCSTPNIDIKVTDFSKMGLLYSFLTFFPSAEFDREYKKRGKILEKNVVGKYNHLTSFISTFYAGYEAYESYKTDNIYDSAYNPLEGVVVIKDQVFNKEGYFTDDVKHDPELRVFIIAIAKRNYDNAWDIVLKSRRAQIGFERIYNRCVEINK